MNARVLLCFLACFIIIRAELVPMKSNDDIPIYWWSFFRFSSGSLKIKSTGTLIINPEGGYQFDFYKKDNCIGTFEFCARVTNDEGPDAWDCRQHSAQYSPANGYRIEINDAGFLKENNHAVDKRFWPLRYYEKYIKLEIRRTWSCEVEFYAKQYLRYSDRNLSPDLEDWKIAIMALSVLSLIVFIVIVIVCFRKELGQCICGKSEPETSVEKNLEAGQAGGVEGADRNANWTGPKDEKFAFPDENAAEMNLVGMTRRETHPSQFENSRFGQQSKVEPKPATPAPAAAAAKQKSDKEGHIDKKPEKKKSRPKERPREPESSQSTPPKRQQRKLLPRDSVSEKSSERKHRLRGSHPKKESPEPVRLRQIRVQGRPTEPQGQVGRNGNAAEVSQAQANLRIVGREAVSSRPSEIQGNSTMNTERNVSSAEARSGNQPVFGSNYGVDASHASTKQSEH